MVNTTSIALLISATYLLQTSKPQHAQEQPPISLPALVGTYYQGDGLGERNSLLITPGGRFLFESSGCLGLSDFNVGTVELVNGRLILRPEAPNLVRVGLLLLTHGEILLDAQIEDPSELVELVRVIASDYIYGRTPRDLIPVRWGERLHLVPTDEGQDFCNCVNLGLFSVVPYRNFYLRVDDVQKKAIGLPNVPQEWKSMLLPRPIQGKVIEIQDDGRAKVDLGAEHGVWKGMQLWIDSQRSGWAEVVEVHAKTCLIEVHRDDHWARNGRLVRSRKPDVE